MENNIKKYGSLAELKKGLEQDFGSRDSFTKLYNKVPAMEYARQAITLSEGPIYFCMLDLDHFKECNDYYGHTFGDQVLIKTASVLEACLEGKGIASRFGGDEFFFVLDGVANDEELRLIIRKVRTSIAEAISSTSEKVVVTCSVGISMYPRNGEDFDTLFEKADRGLYIAKNKGRNRFIIYLEDLHGHVTDKDLFEENSRAAEVSLLSNIVRGMSDVCVELIRGRVLALPSVLEKVRQLYSYDFSGLFLGSQMEAAYTSAQWPKELTALPSLRSRDVLSFFNANGYHYVSLSRPSTVQLEDFHGVLAANGIQDSIFVLIGDKIHARGALLLGNYQVRSERLPANQEFYLLVLLAQMIGEYLPA